jgi:hypothetical protein
MGNCLVMAEPEPHLDFSRPSPLRLIGFLLVALGGLLAGIGVVITWVTVGLTDDKNNVLTQRYLGTDLPEGKVVLAAGLILLGGIIVLRRVRGPFARRAVAALLIVASLLTVGIAIKVATGAHRYADKALQDMTNVAAVTLKLPPDQARQRVDQIASLGITVTRGTGVWLALAGGLLAAAGAVLSLVWALRREAGAPSGETAVIPPRLDPGPG